MKIKWILIIAFIFVGLFLMAVGVFMGATSGIYFDRYGLHVFSDN